MTVPRSTMKKFTGSEALTEIKHLLNGQIFSHMEKEDLRPSELAALLQTDVLSVQRFIGYQLDGYTVDDMVMYVMRLGYTVRTQRNQDGKLTIIFEKVPK